MPRKHSQEFIETEFLNVGYTLLDKYLNSKTLMYFRCDRNHYHWLRYSDLKQGVKCTICQNRVKLTIEFVRDEFKKIGYTLLSTIYGNSYTKLVYICDNNHTNVTTWNAIKQNKRCTKCVGGIRLTIEHVREQFLKANYILRTTKYSNDTQWLKFICDHGHEETIRYKKFQVGRRCGTCFALKQNGGYFNQFAAIKGRIRKKTNLDESILERIFNDILPKILPFHRKCEKGYHTDHIIPISFFNQNNETEIYACWNINNLRHLTAKENLIRHNNFSYNEFINLTPEQLEILKIASNKPAKFNILLNHPSEKVREAELAYWKRRSDSGRK